MRFVPSAIRSLPESRSLLILADVLTASREDLILTSKSSQTRLEAGGFLICDAAVFVRKTYSLLWQKSCRGIEWKICPKIH